MPHVDGVRHRDVVVRGLRLHVAEAGEGDPVVLLHGWPQHWWLWRHLIPALAGRYRVLCPDLRGFGWSEAPADDDYLKETLVDDLLALLDELGIDRVRFVGHDWGGYVGFLACLRADHPIERMVTLSIVPPWPPPGGLDLRRLSRLSYQLPIAAPAPAAFRTRVFATALRAGRADGELTPEELDAYLAPLRRHKGRRASALLYRTFLLREVGPLLRGKYLERRLSVPTLLLIGERDLLYDPVIEQVLRSHADQVEFEGIAGAGHFLPEERPELVRERVLEFLARA